MFKVGMVYGMGTARSDRAKGPSHPSNRRDDAVPSRVQFSSDARVDHPPHYGGEDDPYEAIKVIEAWDLGFHLGNTVKYIRRADLKGDPVTDLEKALWYLEREIERRRASENVP